MSQRLTLDPEPNRKKVTENKNNKAVQSALKLIKDNFSAKSDQDQKNRTIRDMIQDGFDIREPDGPRRINMKKLYQAFWKTMQRVKLLDFTLHASQRPEFMEKITTDGISTVLRRSGYVSMFRDKGGLFQNGFGYGYAFGLMGTQEQGFPIKFTALANDNVYVDARATGMRSGSKKVKKCCVITSMTWAEFEDRWPKWAKVAGPGRIPRNETFQEQDQDELQEVFTKDRIEVAYYYDIVNKHFVHFAGSLCTINPEGGDKGGKDYPFVFKNKNTNEKEAYIPVIHFSCMPSFKGFYDYGIFDAIYDLSLLYNRILNMQANYTADGVDPVKFFSVPQGEAAKLFQKMDMAMRMRAQGKPPIAAIEYDPSNPGTSQIGAQSLQVQSLINEAQVMFDRIDLEIKRFGINLDEPEAGNITATQILADEENANRFVKQVMENNASEFEFIVNILLDQIPKVIKKSNKTPLQMTTKVKVPVEGAGEEAVRADGITLGMLAEELKEHEYFVKVNARSGADMSKLKMAQLTSTLGITPPGTPAFFTLLSQIAGLRDVDLDETAFGAQPAAPPGQPIPAGAPVPEEPGPTEPITFNPRSAEQQAVL